MLLIRFPSGVRMHSSTTATSRPVASCFVFFVLVD
jgi:hypothetical protein